MSHFVADELEDSLSSIEAASPVELMKAFFPSVEFV
jgi:hypothetical protein